MKDNLLIIIDYILGLALMILFEYKIGPKIGKVPNNKEFFTIGLNSLNL